MIVRGTMAIGQLALVLTNTNREDIFNPKWIVDSGASDHVCRERRDFQKLSPLSQNVQVIIGDESPMIATAKGTSLPMRPGFVGPARELGWAGLGPLGWAQL